MPQTPTDKEEPTGQTDAQSSTRPSRRTKFIVLGAILLAIAAVVAIVVLLVTAGGDTETSTSSDTDTESPDVTSPYDLHELPADTEPVDVGTASLVSISIAGADGTADYYGLSSDTAPAKALIDAVSKAQEVDATETGAALGTTEVSEGQPAGSVITFLLPDRSTLAFELYVEQGIVARGGRFWRVEGDLATLIDAAVSLHEQQ